MNQQSSKKGKVVIVSGPSGVGKSTICNKVVEQIENARLSISVTTRPKAENEIDGQHYSFVSIEQFQRLIEGNRLLEHAEVFGNLYGTPRDQIDEALKSKKIIILEIDIQGAKQAKLMYPEAVMIFILPPTQTTLAERINQRGREDSGAAARRLEQSGSEIAAAREYYEHMIVNDDLEQAVKQVVQIIQENAGEEE